MQGNMERHYAIKFCVKLKTKQEAYEMLKEVYKNEQMSQASFYRWFSRFFEKNKQVEDEPRFGAPKSACKEENIQEVLRLVMEDRRKSVMMISEAVGISIGTVDTILTEDLKLHKVCAKFVPKILSDDQNSFVWNVLMVPSGQCPMLQVNGGYHLDGRQGNENDTTPTL